MPATDTSPKPPGPTNPPAKPDTPPDNHELSPYELAKLNKPTPPPPPPVSPPEPPATYEPAGPTVSWFDGTTLGDWKVVRANPTAVTVKEGAIEFDPGDNSVFIEHALTAADYDLSYEFREGPAEQGCWAELYMPAGVVQMDGAHFQSSNFTPVKIQVRGGKITATCGTKGPNDIGPAPLNTTPPADNQGFTGGRAVVLLMMSTTDTKSIRNIQYTPMRKVAAPAPPPTPAPAAGAGMLAQPLTLKADKIDQPAGQWERFQVGAEGNRNFLSWSFAASQNRTADFIFAGDNRNLPDKIHLHFECRVRNTDARRVVVRFWGPNGGFGDTEATLAAADTWTTADINLDGCAGTVIQLEIRLPENPGENAFLDLGDFTLSAR